MLVNSSISSSRARAETVSYGRFLFAFFAPLACTIPFLAASYAFLKNTGELDSIEDIAAAQRTTGALYGTALHPNIYAYKLALLHAADPEVVAIGSSRVLQIRAGSFAQPFVNLGRTVNYPDEAVKLIDDMLAISRPRVALLGVDFWWFNPGMKFAFTFDTHRVRGGELSSDALLAPVRWLLEGKLDARTFRDIATGGHPLRVEGVPMFGVQAGTRGNGFAGDGSYYYLGTVYGRSAAEDPRFADTLGRIARNEGQFRRAEAPDEERLARLKYAVARLEAAGVRVITFLPPVAGRVLAALRQDGDGYAYIDRARRRLAEIGRHHYDFHDPAILGAGDCEFVDGFHGGDVLFARILERIGADPDSGLAPYLNLEQLRSVIDNNKNRSLADDRYRRPGEKERDFLELGCDKS